MRVSAVLVVLLAAGAAGADAPARRVTLGIAGVMFASYPLSIEDPGPAVMVASPFWLGPRGRHFQWALDGSALVGFGTESKHVHASVAPQFGFNLFLGSVFGFELRLGPAGILQAGDETVAGLGISTAAAYVFRFWDDDRRRVKLVVMMQMGGYFADDPGNDLGMNAGAFGLGLAYETPL